MDKNNQNSLKEVVTLKNFWKLGVLIPLGVVGAATIPATVRFLFCFVLFCFVLFCFVLFFWGEGRGMGGGIRGRLGDLVDLIV